MNIEVVHRIGDRYLPDLLELYGQEEWTRKRKPGDVVRMLEHSFVIGLIDREKDRLIGFSRILTDFVFRATVYDVIVRSDYHGQGLGRVLLDEIVNHPQLKSIERIELYCAPDKIEFYNK